MPDAIALRILAAFAAEQRLPFGLVVATAFLESGLDVNAIGDGGLACGIIQVRSDVHGRDCAWWSGYEGAARSLALMGARWRVAFQRLGNGWTDATAEGRALYLQQYQPAAQGSEVPSIERCREAVAIAASVAIPEQEPTSMVPKPTIVQKSAHPNNIREGRGGKAAECIVVHTMAGTLAGCDSWFANAAAGASAHFSVGRNGEIHQYVALTDTAIANGNEAGANPWIVRENPGTNINLISVSIEHDDQAKPGTLAGFPTPQQFEASAQLAAWIWDAWIVPGGATNLAIDRNHILRHAELAPSTRAGCPGWPEEMLQRYVARVAEIVAGPVVQPPPIDVRAIVDDFTALAIGFDDLSARAAVMAQSARAAAAKVAG